MDQQPLPDLGQGLFIRFSLDIDLSKSRLNPLFNDQIAPLAAALGDTADYEKGLELRRKINELLIGVDKKKYKLNWDGHLASHFGIVGFTTTPVSATIPNIDRMLRLKPMTKCPIVAPTSPKGIADMTMAGWA